MASSSDQELSNSATGHRVHNEPRCIELRPPQSQESSNLNSEKPKPIPLLFRPVVCRAKIQFSSNHDLIPLDSKLRKDRKINPLLLNPLQAEFIDIKKSDPIANPNEAETENVNSQDDDIKDDHDEDGTPKSTSQQNRNLKNGKTITKNQTSETDNHKVSLSSKILFAHESTTTESVDTERTYDLILEEKLDPKTGQDIVKMHDDVGLDCDSFFKEKIKEWNLKAEGRDRPSNQNNLNENEEEDFDEDEYNLHLDPLTSEGKGNHTMLRIVQIRDLLDSKEKVKRGKAIAQLFKNNAHLLNPNNSSNTANGQKAKTTVFPTGSPSASAMTQNKSLEASPQSTSTPKFNSTNSTAAADNHAERDNITSDNLNSMNIEKSNEDNNIQTSNTNNVLLRLGPYPRNWFVPDSVYSGKKAKSKTILTKPKPLFPGSGWMQIFNSFLYSKDNKLLVQESDFKLPVMIHPVDPDSFQHNIPIMSRGGVPSEQESNTNTSSLLDQKRPQCYITINYPTEEILRNAALQLHGIYIKHTNGEIRHSSFVQLVTSDNIFQKEEQEMLSNLSSSRAQQAYLFKKRTRDQELAIAERERMKTQFQAVEVEDKQDETYGGITTLGMNDHQKDAFKKCWMRLELLEKRNTDLKQAILKLKKEEMIIELKQQDEKQKREEKERKRKRKKEKEEARIAKEKAQLEQAPWKMMEKEVMSNNQNQMNQGQNLQNQNIGNNQQQNHNLQNQSNQMNIQNQNQKNMNPGHGGPPMSNNKVWPGPQQNPGYQQQNQNQQNMNKGGFGGKNNYGNNMGVGQKGPGQNNPNQIPMHNNHNGLNSYNNQGQQQGFFQNPTPAAPPPPIQTSANAAQDAVRNALLNASKAAASAALAGAVQGVQSAQQVGGPGVMQQAQTNSNMGQNNMNQNMSMNQIQNQPQSQIPVVQQQQATAVRFNLNLGGGIASGQQNVGNTNQMQQGNLQGGINMGQIPNQDQNSNNMNFQNNPNNLNPNQIQNQQNPGQQSGEGAGKKESLDDYHDMLMG